MSEADFREQQEGRPFPLPPASFEFLTESLRLQAEMQLGLMRFGSEEQPPADLELARHTIDLMGMLKEKTRGNLSLEEQRQLENTLTLLRFRYVQVVEETRKIDAKAAESKPAESPQTASAEADSQKA